jgi:hypothetical protein
VLVDEVVIGVPEVHNQKKDHDASHCDRVQCDKKLLVLGN